MASTRNVGNKKEITIRNDVFETVEEAINYFEIVHTQFYQVKSYFKINEPHKVIMICLNYGIDRHIHRSVNLSKYLDFIRTRVDTLTELWIKSDSKALSQFLNMQESKQLHLLAKKIAEFEPDPLELPIELSKEEAIMPKPTNQAAQPSIDFSSFNSEQDFNKIGMQFVLASNIKALKDFIEILEEVSFPIPAEKVYQLSSDLEPIQKMVNDSMNIIKNLVEEGKTY